MGHKVRFTDFRQAEAYLHCIPSYSPTCKGKATDRMRTEDDRVRLNTGDLDPKINDIQCKRTSISQFFMETRELIFGKTVHNRTRYQDGTVTSQ